MGSNKHRLGINALQRDQKSQKLYTASRDATVKIWEGQNAIYSLDHHTDWVNDIVLIKNDQFLVSASSDTTLKVWNTSEGTCAGTISSKHTDYVKALAYAPKGSPQLVASSGLDKTINIWDVEHLVTINQTKIEPLVSVSKAQKSSIYSLASSEDGNTLVSGSPEKVIRVWDPRTGRKQKKLIGHTDNVKALLLNSDGTLCLSGSSDGTVKLWDLGQQRCICTYTMDDSVWALQSNQSFTEFCAGCRDGSVVKINSSNSQTQQLFEEQNSIMKLLLVPEDDSIWVATTSSTIHRWSCKVEFKESSAEPPTISEPSTQLENQTSLYSKPLEVIEGAPGIVKYHVLHNKRHVLVMDSSQNAQLFDIVQARKLKDFGNRNFDELVKELSEQVWVPNWFSMDTKIGSIMVHLNDSHCFNVETYVSDLGWESDSDDSAKRNLGHLVVTALFIDWKRATKQSEVEEESDDSASTENKDQNSQGDGKKSDKAKPKTDTDKQGQKGEPPEEPSLFTKLKGLAPKAPVTTNSNGTNVKSPISEASSKETTENDDDFDKDEPPFEMPPNTAVILSEETASTGTSVSFFRCKVSEVHNEIHKLNKITPRWVYDCVRKGYFVPKDTTKLTFVLISEKEKEIPSLPQNGRRLSAFRILRVKKIIQFIVTKLKLDDPNPEANIEIICNDQVLPLSMDLGTVKMCIWKNNSELQLVYRKKKQAK